MKVNQLKVGIILAYVNTIVSNLIGIFYTPILLRLLGKSEYGLYNLCASTISALSILHLGFGSSYIRFYTKAKREKEYPVNTKQVNGMFMLVFSAIALLAFVCSMIISVNVKVWFADSLTETELEKARILFVLMGINLSITLLNSAFAGIVAVHEQFIYQRVVTLLKTILNPLSVILVLSLGFKSVGMVCVLTMVTLLACISDSVFCWKFLKERFSFKNLNFSVFKELGVFTFYVFFALVTEQVSWQVDKIVLGKCCSTGAVAVYTIGANLNSYFQQISNNVSNVFAPRINDYAIRNERENINQLFIKVGRIQFSVLLFIMSAFFLFGRQFIYWWAGNEYGNAYYIALLFMFCGILPLSESLGNEIQKAYFKHKFLNIMYFIFALINIIISIPLAQYWGEVGAALGTFIVMILTNNILANWYYSKKLDVDIQAFLYNLFTLLKPLCVTVLFAILFFKVDLISSFVGFFIMAILYSILYLGVIWKTSLNEYEKSLIINLLIKFIKPKKK